MAKRTTKRRITAESKRTRNYSSVSIGALEKIVKAELPAEVTKLVRKVGGQRTAFQSVVKAREILAQSSVLAARMIGKAAKVAASKGDSAPAEFLLKHVAALDDQGKTVRPLATSVDKLETEAGSRAPVINIGWITAAPAPAAALPYIDAKLITDGKA